MIFKESIIKIDSKKKNATGANRDYAGRRKPVFVFLNLSILS